jgi:hypothetical protein
LNSLERITEYLELPQEREGREPPASWPSAKEGETLLEVKDLEMRFVLVIDFMCFLRANFSSLPLPPSPTYPR